MCSKYLSAALILVFSFACVPAAAQKRDIIQSGGKPIGGVTTGDAIAIVVVAMAVVAVVAFVVIHESRTKRSITGCVSSGPNGMMISDEKDRQVYALSGDTAGVKPGDRMKLRGRKIKSRGPDKALTWEAGNVAKDFGVCRP